MQNFNPILGFFFVVTAFFLVGPTIYFLNSCCLYIQIRKIIKFSRKLKNSNIKKKNI